MMYFLILICCIFCVFSIILFQKLSKNGKELEDLKIEYEKYEELQNKTIFYENEVQRLNEQLKQQKSTLMKNGYEYKYNKIFEGKKAIVGNYSTFMANETKEMLQKFGLSVETVRTGTELLEKVKNGCKYDIIFTNHIYQQEFDGVELLKRLRNLNGFETPVVVHTVSQNQRYDFMVSLGFDEYIEKPIQPEEIERVLKKFLK